jgi:cell wall-associated NlpC family hydrolase
VPKIRRGGLIFLAWKGDHGPRHVHVYRGGKLIVKWDLENWQPMKGEASARIRRLLTELVEEGRL